jgi:hypothetical protein
MGTMNFNHWAANGTLLGGAIIGSEAMMTEGRHGLEQWPLRTWCWFDGSTQESIDHYYFSISLKDQKVFADLAPTPFDRMMGRNPAMYCGVFPVVEKESEISVTVEDKMSVTAVGPLAPGQDIFVALYPQARDEAAPRYEVLADGVARITTSPCFRRGKLAPAQAGGVDYVFLSSKSIQFANDEVSFAGVAGAVRVFAGEVHLILSEGAGTVSYRGTTLHSEIPALKVIPKTDLAKKQTFDMHSPWKLKNTALPEGCRLEGPARCELTIQSDRLVGRSEGHGGFLYAPTPAGMKVLPTLVIDGQTYAPGTSGETLIIPLLPGEHSFEVRALEQPPVFRNWQAWK